MTKGKPRLDSLEVVPIARLNPDIPSIDSYVVHALITLTWPYNSIKKSVAFRAAEPDFRLRQDNGQVRVQLHGPAARAVAESGIGSGDEIIFSLEGAAWVSEEQQYHLSGGGIKWQLVFRDKLRLLVCRVKDILKLTFRRNLKTNFMYQAILAEDGGNKLIEIDHPAESHEHSPEPLTQYKEISPECENAFDTGLETCSSSLRSRFNDALDGEYSSPAYLKRQRLSRGSLFEGSWEEDGGIVGKGRKRTRFSHQHDSWRLTSQSPPEEPDPIPRSRSQPNSEPGTEIDAESPAACSDLYCPDLTLRRSLAGSPLCTNGSVDLPQATGVHFDVIAEDFPPPNTFSRESRNVTSLSQDSLEKAHPSCPSTPNSDTQVTTNCINKDGVSNGQSTSPAEQNVLLVGSDPTPPDISNEAASLRSDSHVIPFDRVPPGETSQDHYLLEYPQQPSFEAHTSSQSSTPPDMVARPPQECGNMHPYSNPHNSIIVSHGGNDSGISWAITSQPAGPEPLAEQFNPEAAVEQDNESQTSTRYQIPQLAPERTATYLNNEEDETLIWTSRDALLELQEQVEICNGDVEEEGESDEIEDQGADYDIRNYADVQDDEEGYDDPDFERSEEYYDEDSDGEEEGSIDDVHQDGYDQYEHELAYREGLYSQFHTSRHQAFHNGPPHAQRRQPEVIDLVSDSDSEDENGREHEDIQNEKEEETDKEAEKEEIEEEKEEEEVDNVAEEGAIEKAEKEEEKNFGLSDEEHGIVSDDSGARDPVLSLPYSLPNMALGTREDDGPSASQNKTCDPMRNYIAPVSPSLLSALAPEAGVAVNEIRDEIVEDSKEPSQRSLCRSEARPGSHHWRAINDGDVLAGAEIMVPYPQQEEVHDADQARIPSLGHLTKTQAMDDAVPTDDLLREEGMAQEVRDVTASSNNDKPESLVVECLGSGVSVHMAHGSSSPIAKKGSCVPQMQSLVEHVMVSDDCRLVNRGAGLEVIRLDSDEEDNYDLGENVSKWTVTKNSEEDLTTGEIVAEKMDFEKLAEEQAAVQEQVVAFHDETHKPTAEKVTKEKLTTERVGGQFNGHETVDARREETPLVEIGHQRPIACPGSPSPSTIEEKPLARLAASDTSLPVEGQVLMDDSYMPVPVEYGRTVDDGIECHGSQTSNSCLKNDCGGPLSNANGDSVASLSQQEMLEQAAVDVAQSFTMSTQVTADEELMGEVNYDSQLTDISSTHSIADVQSSYFDKATDETPSLSDTFFVQAPQRNPGAKPNDCQESQTENKTRQASKDDVDAALYKGETASPTLVPTAMLTAVSQEPSTTRVLCRGAGSHIQVESPPTPSTRYGRRGSDTRAGSSFVTEMDSEAASASTRPRRRGRPPKAKPEPQKALANTPILVPDVTLTLPTRRVTRQATRTAESAESASGDHSIDLARAAIAERKRVCQPSQSFESVPVQSTRVLRSSFRRSPSPEIITHIAQEAPSLACQDRRAEVARTSPHLQDVSPKRSKPILSKVKVEVPRAVDKECLEKTLKEELGEYSPLAGFRTYVNKENFSGILVAAAEPSEPFRVRGGRREFLLAFPATDHSMASAGQVVEVKVYHRNRERLPIIKPGDGVLLRVFSVVAIRGKGFGLQSNAKSSWVVFEKDEEGAQIRDGPVEVSDMEEKWTRDQMTWFERLDEKIKRKMQRAEVRRKIEVVLEKAK